MPQNSPETPQIAAALTNGLRRTLIEDGRWPAIEQRLLTDEPDFGPWLKSAERADWVSLQTHLRFVDYLTGLFGESEMIAIGAARLRGDTEAGPLGPLLRGWIREYGHDPRQLVRVIPHAWAAVTRGAGRLVLARSEPQRVVFRGEGAPPWIGEFRGWQAFLIGFGTELMRSAGAHASFSVSLDGLGGSLEAVATWGADPAG